MYGMSKNKVSLRSNFNQSNSYAKFRVEAYNYMLKIKKKYKSNMVTAILFNHDSMFRKKKFLIPRLVKLIKSKNTLKIDSIFKENISGYIQEYIYTKLKLLHFSLRFIKSLISNR